MGIRRKRCLDLARLTTILLLASTVAYGSAFNVVVNSSTSFNGSPVTLAFDFTNGGSPDNMVTLFALTFSADWTPDGTPVVDPAGSVKGTDPWTFTDAGDTCGFPCELRVPFSAMGTRLSFSFTTTDNLPDAGSFPDAFSFFMLDLARFPLFPTSDTTGADALLLLSIGGAGDCGLSLCPYSPDPAIEGFSLSVTPVTPAPEPGTLALLAAGFGAMLRRRRST